MNETMEKKPRTYAFDFDGVIAQTDGFKGSDYVAPVNLEVVKAIKLLKEQGNKIIIYSTRGTEFLKEYCQQQNIPVDYINENPDYQTPNPGKPIAAVYIDDHGLCYRGQSAEQLIEEITNFKTYWQ